MLALGRVTARTASTTNSASSSTIMILLIFSTPFWSPMAQTRKQATTTRIIYPAMGRGRVIISEKTWETPVASSPSNWPVAILTR